MGFLPRTVTGNCLICRYFKILKQKYELFGTIEPSDSGKCRRGFVRKADTIAFHSSLSTITGISPRSRTR